jgi:hypothetical protein
MPVLVPQGSHLLSLTQDRSEIANDTTLYRFQHLSRYQQSITRLFRFSLFMSGVLLVYRYHASSALIVLQRWKRQPVFALNMARSCKWQRDRQPQSLANSKWNYCVAPVPIDELTISHYNSNIDWYTRV